MWQKGGEHELNSTNNGTKRLATATTRTGVLRGRLFRQRKDVEEDMDVENEGKNVAPPKLSLDWQGTYASLVWLSRSLFHAFSFHQRVILKISCFPRDEKSIRSVAGRFVKLRSAVMEAEVKPD